MDPVHLTLITCRNPTEHNPSEQSRYQDIAIKKKKQKNQNTTRLAQKFVHHCYTWIVEVSCKSITVIEVNDIGESDIKKNSNIAFDPMFFAKDV